jgi:bla regulator protein BlaR1
MNALESVFGWLLAASWQASILALLVLALQRIFRAQLNPRWHHALWLLVLLRLVLPALPESTLSLFQFAPPAPQTLIAPVTEPLFPVGPPRPIEFVSSPTAAEPGHPFSLFSILALIWLAGSLILVGATFQVNRRFARLIARSPEIADVELVRLFAEAKQELGIHGPIRLVENKEVRSPAIMGLFSPTLLLPVRVRDRFDSRELRLIFLHEVAHVKRGDVAVQALIALLQIVHWFNPVLWYAFGRMRLDREPATDALVLSRAGEEERERYGLMLIKLLEHFSQRHSLPTLVGILEDKDQLKRRFGLIARFTSGAYGWSILGVITMAFLAAGCLTKQVQASSVAPMQSPGKPVDSGKEKNQSQGSDVLPAPEHETAGEDMKQELAEREGQLLLVKEDANARRVLEQSLKDLPDDQWISTLQGLGRADATIQSLQMDVNNMSGDLASLLRSGLSAGNPQVEALRAELEQRQQQLQKRVAGERRTMALVSQMADSRVIFLSREVDALKAKLQEQKNSDSATPGPASNSAPNPSGASLDENKPTRLFLATLPDEAERLIAEGADVKARNLYGATALHFVDTVAGTNGAAVARVLLQHGAEVNAADFAGLTPLMTAQDGATVDVLVQFEADLKAQNKMASTWGELPQADPEGHGVLGDNPHLGDVSYYQALIRHGVAFDPKTQGAALMLKAAEKNRVDVMAWLVEEKVDPKAGFPGYIVNGQTTFQYPLDGAATTGSAEAVKFLLDHGAEVYATTYAEALERNQAAVVKLLWKHGPRYCSELAYAVEEDQPVSEVEKLLHSGSSEDSSEDRIISPLDIAVEKGNLAVAQLLVKAGAAVNAVHGPFSPLTFAAQQEQPAMVNFLLKNGAKADTQALLFAIQNSLNYPENTPKEGAPETMKLLIAAGALKKISEDEAAALLVVASNKKNAAMLQLLLDAGLNPQSRRDIGSEKGETATEIVEGEYAKRNTTEPYNSDLKPMLDLLAQAGR